MDLVKAIRDLYEEKKRLDVVIASLESMQAAEARLPRVQAPPKKRGRKSMSPEEREQVSERMRRYWAEKRDGQAKAARSSTTNGG